DAIYVSTTLGGSRYERVAGYTLGARSTATIEVTSAGVLLLRPATRSVFIPAAALREVGTSGGMVGKYVGGEGLVVLRWQLGDHVLDTGLRLGHRADVTPVLDAVRTLITQASAPRGEPPDLQATPADEAHPATPEDPGPARPSDAAPADQTSDRAEGPRTDDEGRP